MRRIISEETKQAILEAYKSGEKLTVIADRFGIARPYASILASRRGLLKRTSAHGVAFIRKGLHSSSPQPQRVTGITLPRLKCLEGPEP